jgi:hypothetical protein
MWQIDGEEDCALTWGDLVLHPDKDDNSERITYAVMLS